MPANTTPAPGYRGRLAPSPTGSLHSGHARTFLTAWRRAREAGGILVYRNEDIDRSRARPAFAASQMEDLRWLGITWQEGPDIGGPCGPYNQSARLPLHIEAFNSLRAAGFLYPCTCTRRDVAGAAGAPHGETTAAGMAPGEPPYPGTCRPAAGDAAARKRIARLPRQGVNWRFRVPEGERIEFVDGGFGPQSAVAGRTFGDFIVWRRDDTPSYQLACAVDDAAMGITEVVRGADLLVSTFRQILLLRALGLATPRYFHCPLVTDESGTRLSKRDGAASLKALRAGGVTPEDACRIAHGLSAAGPDAGNR